MTNGSPEKLEQLRLMLDRGSLDKGVPHGVFLERIQKWILHFNLEHLHGPEEVDYDLEELVVVCLVRDGRPYVKSFIEHYRSLGVKHLVFLDNGSTDGTVEALKGYDNTTVLRTALPFKRYKWSMKQYLTERFGRGRWCLCVDIDELFDYPYSDIVGLGSLLRYLNERSYTAVVGQMLDMFPEEPLSDGADDLGDEALRERHRFYDISNVRKVGYVTDAVDIRDHWAYRHGQLYSISGFHAQHHSAADAPDARAHWACRKTCGTGNVLANDEIKVYAQGIQKTVFGSGSPLTKHPLVFVDEKVKPMDFSLHSISNASIADFTCVLFHYKFLNYLYELTWRAAQQDRYGNPKYEKWLGVLEKNPSLLIKGESAVELRSVNELVENEYLVLSEEYMMLAYEEEERKQGGHTPRRAGPVDEAAFLHRARARAELQGLRARSLERRLEELRERNRREIDKLEEKYKRRIERLQGQHQRQIERLSRRLARTKKRARKKKQALAKRLRGIRASRSWRMLNKLARLRARVLGRKR